MQSVGWSFSCKNAKEINLPMLQSVGGSFDCNQKIKIGKKEFDLKIIDNNPTLLISKPKIIDGFTVQKAQYADNFKDDEFDGKKCFIACKNGVYAHGKTIKQAIYDVEFKGIDRTEECKKYKSFTLETRLDLKDWYLVYRNITGACSDGSWHFIESNNLDGEYSLTEVIKITQNAHESNIFREFFKELK